MKISLNTIRFINQKTGSAGEPAPDGAEALAEKIGAQLGAIEEVIGFGSKYEGVLVVKVVGCSQHPNADKLKVCKIDDGGRTEGVERDEQGYVQVVCGAPNVREGLLVAWLPPGSTVPESVGKEPFVLGSRELRGVVSNGMLASARELAIGDSHDGILEITLDADEEVTPGTPFVEAFHLQGDVIFDIENKMFTHRPDCFGFMGVAREIEGIQHRAYKSPDWYVSDAGIPEPEVEVLPLEVRNDLPDLVPRFTAVAMSGIQVKQSPLWLQLDLVKAGIRPINNIVDYTNFFMLLTGQPLHAYDYDKVRALDGPDAGKATIVVRQPGEGEKIALLNGKEIEPRREAVMIATGTRLIGVGGVMGGADTEVDEGTTNIILECANFDMYSIRRTSMAHGLFTDAVSRFNKGQSPLQNRAVIARIVDEIRRNAGGKVAGPLIDEVSLPDEDLALNNVHPPVTVSIGFINARLGLHLSSEEAARLLTNVEFHVWDTGSELIVTAPFWRTDIEMPEDVVEEVGRLYGFDRLPLVLPRRDIAPARRNASFDLKQQLRETLRQSGANEVLTYSFVHGNLLSKTGQDAGKSYELGNALSPDLQYYRQSLTPSLLDKVHANIKAGAGEFALFEIGRSHIKDILDDEGLPRAFERLSLVFAADVKSARQYEGAAYYQAKRYLDALLDACNVAGTVAFEPITGNETDPAAVYFAPGRAATITLDGKVLGRIGEYKPAVRKSLKLPDYCAGFELGIGVLSEMASSQSSYVPLSRYPKVEQDICLKVDVGLPYVNLFDFVSGELRKSAPEDASYSLGPVDIYRREDDPGHKQVTFRLTIASYDKTLRDTEVAALLDSVAAAAGTQFGAVRI